MNHVTKPNIDKTSQKIWLKSPLAVFTASNSDASGGLVVHDDKIIECISAGQTPKSEYDSVIECGNFVLTPGLINTHHHFYQTLTRCLPQAINKPLFPWLKTLYKVWQHLDDEMLYSATQLASLELMLSGTSMVCDHHYVFPKGLDNAIDIQAEALKQLGCRAMLTRGSMSLGESDGGLPPDSVVQTQDTIIQDSIRVIKQHHESFEGAYLNIALAPCSPFSVTTELMQETASVAQKHNVLLHTHLAETEDENVFCERMYGMRPLAYLDKCNWLGPQTWLAHGIHFSADEITLLGKHKVGIAHCPSSNMLLASGICPTLELEKAGCKIGMAVDGSASNDCSNLSQEVRQSLLQQRLKYGAELITAEKVLGWATAGSASVLHRNDIGELAPGKQADIAFFDLNELRFSGAGDPIAALVTCGVYKASKLMVGGNLVIEDEQHANALSEQILHQHTQLAKQLHAKSA
ncbi:8-oxoguanine deaminase [Glaciecola sp. KUL10]|uniref:8-oxoguanine deaminase n=1 Tax=Glaciecola sp. (strain KUL10) TaxID=2161813 RepID=UPI000D782F41|nr:8-oxoguanine deaminase [Glaciecola sp. KUL10]GBL05227.1 hydroxydechloroatrazine ethylaminohydrolase [Glaciecola sp. KUL10]